MGVNATMLGPLILTALTSCAAAPSGPVAAACGDPNKYAQLALWVRDLEKGAAKSAELLRELGAVELPPDCRFSRSLGSHPNAPSKLLVRWLPVEKVAEAQRALVSLGSLDYYDSNTEKAGVVPADVQKYRALKEESDNGVLAKTPLTRELVEDEVTRLEPAARAFEQTGSKILFSLQLFARSGDDRDEAPKLPKELSVACRRHHVSCTSALEVMKKLYETARAPSASEIVGAFTGIAYGDHSTLPVVPALLTMNEEVDEKDGRRIRPALFAGQGVPAQPPFSAFIAAHATRKEAFDFVSISTDATHFSREVLGVQGVKTIGLIEKYHLRRLGKDELIVLSDDPFFWQYFYFTRRAKE